MMMMQWDLMGKHRSCGSQTGTLTQPRVSGGPPKRKRRGKEEEEEKEENEEKEGEAGGRMCSGGGNNQFKGQARFIPKTSGQTTPSRGEHLMGGWGLWWVGGGSGTGKEAVAPPGVKLKHDSGGDLPLTLPRWDSVSNSLTLSGLLSLSEDMTTAYLLPGWFED